MSKLLPKVLARIEAWAKAYDHSADVTAAGLDVQIMFRHKASAAREIAADLRKLIEE